MDNYNDPQNNKLVIPCTLEEGDTVKHGFRFNQNMDISSEIPQLYGKYIRKGNLKNDQILSPIFRKDLEKFYLRSTLELLGKYFTKRGKYCYLYNSVPLFVPGSSLVEAEQRLKRMKTKQRKRKNEDM